MYVDRWKQTAKRDPQFTSILVFLNSCFGSACTKVHAGKKGGSTVCGSMTAVSPSSSSLNRKIVKAIFDLSAFS